MTLLIRPASTISLTNKPCTINFFGLITDLIIKILSKTPEFHPSQNFPQQQPNDKSSTNNIHNKTLTKWI